MLKKGEANVYHFGIDHIETDAGHEMEELSSGANVKVVNALYDIFKTAFKQLDESGSLNISDEAFRKASENNGISIHLTLDVNESQDEKE